MSMLTKRFAARLCMQHYQHYVCLFCYRSQYFANVIDDENESISIIGSNSRQSKCPLGDGSGENIRTLHSQILASASLRLGHYRCVQSRPKKDHTRQFCPPLPVPLFASLSMQKVSSVSVHMCNILLYTTISHRVWYCTCTTLIEQTCRIDKWS